MYCTKHFFCACICAVFVLGLLFSCSSEPSIDSDKTNIQTTQIDTTSLEEIAESYKLRGYIGEAKVEFEYHFVGESGIEGSYFYTKYNKPIALTGEIDEGADWGFKTLYEKDDKGNLTGTWNISSANQRIGYIEEGIWRSQDHKVSLPIILYDAETEGFLDDASHMLFESESTAKKFFKRHTFMHHQTYQKRGYIVADNFDNQYENPLPVGLSISSINAWNFDEDFSYTLMEDLKVKDNVTGVISPLSELGVSFVEIGYEIRACRFNWINNDLQVIIADDYRQIAINIVDLEKQGYHLIDEATWLKEKSGSIMGLFPVSYYSEDDFEAVTQPMPIYTQPDFTSKILLNHASEDLGYMSVLDVMLKGDTYWAKVRYDYHDMVPCDSEVLIPEPAVTGWVVMYDDSWNLLLDYYTRGC